MYNFDYVMHTFIENKDAGPFYYYAFDNFKYVNNIAVVIHYVIEKRSDDQAITYIYS